MLRGEVRLGLPGSVCPALAPPLIEAAARRMPHVRLLISEMMSGDLAARLAEGRTDLAILFDVEETEDYGSTHLLTERLHLIGAPGSPHMASETVDAVHLASLDLIGTRLPHGLRLLLERWSTETGIPLRFRFEVDAPTVLVRLAASGFGHAIVSKAAIAHELPAGHLCAAEIASPPIDRKVCLASSKRVPPDASRDAIHRLMREVTSEILAQDAWPGGTGLATFSASSSE
ncbi:MAG: LysR substrate-binding domain-containing protein [Pseudomonadota bacterium]